MDFHRNSIELFDSSGLVACVFIICDTPCPSVVKDICFYKNYTETHLLSQGLILCMIRGIIRWVCSNSRIIKELLLDNERRIMYFACCIVYSS